MRILIGIPTYDRRIDIDIFRTMIGLERRGKHDFDFIFPVSSHISRNRNMIVKECLKDQHNAVFFWDSDIGIEGEDFIEKLLETAYKFDAKIVGGAYRMKKPDLNETVYIAGMEKEDGQIGNLLKVDNPQLCSAVGTGIMLVFREIFEKMPEPWFTIVDGKDLFVMPEDFEFCRKAKELGFNIAIDPRFNTYHYGQFAWQHKYGK